MKPLILFIVLLISIPGYSQWRKATHKLKGPYQDRAHSSFGWINKYDTLPCRYKLIGNDTVYAGYKVVYSENGYYIDNKRTFGKFYDIKKRPIKYVSSYCFKD